MVRYSFPVGLLHSQLHAGLARRTPTTRCEHITRNSNLRALSEPPRVEGKADRGTRRERRHLRRHLAGGPLHRRVCHEWLPLARIFEFRRPGLRFPFYCAACRT